MCAVIATVDTTDKILVLDPRQSFLRKIKIGSNYTDVRMGMTFCFVTSSSDNTAAASETVNIIDGKDYAWIGLKDGSELTPRTAGCRFIGAQGGAVNTTTTVLQGNNGAGRGWVQGGNGNATYGAYDGTTVKGSAEVAFGEGGWQCVTFGAGSGSHSMMGVRIVVNNIGTASQTVTIYYLRNFGLVAQDVNTLYGNLGNGVLGASTLSWNDGSAALPLPEYFYTYVPFVNARLRITAYGALRVS